MSLNQITPKSTIKTSNESNGLNTIWDNLLAESRFCGASTPERNDAIQRINYAISNYQTHKWQQAVLEKIVEALSINPND